MRPAVRLTRRQDGGFRLDGVADDAIEVAPREAGFAVDAFDSGRVYWSAAEHGWVLVAGDDARELGRTTALETERVSSPSSLLLSDGRLFRLAVAGASQPRIELGRWDVPGAYAIGRAESAGWVLERTPAGRLLEAGPELWILMAAEIGRLDGWL
jgi:hypothetical protein